MNKTVLGKISMAEFGTYPDRPFLYGLQLAFSMPGSGVADGGRYTVNISNQCGWDSEEEKQEAFQRILVDEVAQILKDAKVNHVSELIDKPVEIEFENNWFKGFRILTEVL